MASSFPLGEACRSAKGRANLIRMSEFGYDENLDGYSLQYAAPSARPLRPIPDGPMHACDARVWRAVDAIYPQAALNLIGQKVIFASSVRDAESRLDGFYTYDVTNLSYALGLNPYAGDDLDDAWAIVHELGHALHTKPLSFILRACDAGRDSWDECTTGPLLSEFDSSFWGPRITADWTKAAAGEWGLDHDQSTRFRRAHPGVFVTSYAATNVREDLAESLAAWCLASRGGGKVANRKIAWVAKRAEVRELAPRCAELRRVLSP